MPKMQYKGSVMIAVPAWADLLVSRRNERLAGGHAADGSPRSCASRMPSSMPFGNCTRPRQCLRTIKTLRQFPRSLLQKRISLALFADGGHRTMAGSDLSFVRQRHHLLMKRAHDLFHRSTRQICPPNAAGKQRVSGNQLLLLREVNANTAFGVSGRADYV